MTTGKGEMIMDKLITSADLVYLFRIILAIAAGAVIGYEREYREKVAGLRTHILIAMASALMMIVSKYAFMDVLAAAPVPGLSLDVSRVAAGIIAGMGILSGGIVFIGKRGTVSGLTTAAGIWATIGIGMVIGAGMYALGIGSVILVELIQIMISHDLPVYRHETVATVKIKLSDPDEGYKTVVKEFESKGVKLSNLRWEKTPEKEVLIQCNASFKVGIGRDEIAEILNRIPEVTVFELP